MLTSILSWTIFAPLIGAGLLLFFPCSDENHGQQALVRGLAFSTTLITFVLSLWMLMAFDPASSSMQLRESISWIADFGIRYEIGVDGISLFLVLLTTFLMPLVVIASRSVHHKLRGYLFNMLVLETAMIGTFLALDTFLFYLFWELMLVPMYFLIGIWGGKRRIYATLKFVLYTVVGSVLMLIAILYIVSQHSHQFGQMSFLLSDLMKLKFTAEEQFWLFGAFGLAFAIKVPVFPFHTWLPDAHVEAPTGGSVVLAGVLLKMGLYGFIRFAYPLFPHAAQQYAPYLAALAVIGIVYGAMVAWAQHDIKKLVAYSSVSHLGYCVFGFVAFNTISMTGSVYQMLNHGISTGALFLLVGVLYDRRHTREISEYGGLTTQMPMFAVLFLVFTLSSIALPLTNGFIGEFMILLGSFKTFPWQTAIAVSGVVLGAVYMLTLYMKTMFGEIDQAKNGSLSDVNRWELAAFLPLLVMAFYMGIFPQKILSYMQPTIESYIAMVNSRHSQTLRITPQNNNAAESIVGVAFNPQQSEFEVIK